MRILHTADLHLGRQLNGIPLDADHAAILDQIVSAITSRSVDVLVIAGDILTGLPRQRLLCVSSIGSWHASLRRPRRPW